MREPSPSADPAIDQPWRDDEEAEDPEPGATPLAQAASAPLARPPLDPAQSTLDRWLPPLAIVAMIGTFIALPTAVAMTFVAAIWLAWTRAFGRPKLLGLTLTQALAWLATIAIVEFLSILLLFVLSGGAAAAG